MVFKLAMLKLAKPVGILVFGAASAYGYQQWDRAQKSLHIDTTKGDSDIMAIFDNIDKDKSGFIDEEELKDELAKTNIKISWVQLKALMLAADEDHDGKISKKEWLHVCHILQHKEKDTPHVPEKWMELKGPKKTPESEASHPAKWPEPLDKHDK